MISLTEELPKVSSMSTVAEAYMLQSYSMFTSYLSMGRGILIYVKECLGATDFNIIATYKEHVWRQLCLARGDKLLVDCIYRSPHSTVDNDFKLYDMFRNICAKTPSHILILGDFNFKEINWENYSCNTNETHPAYNFLESIRDCYLFQHVKQPTRFRGDFTNEENMIDNISYLPGEGKSDNLDLYFDYHCYTKQQDAKFTKKNYFKGNYNKILDQLMIVDWNQVFRRLSLAESWKVFANKIIKLVESDIPECKGPRDPTKKNPYVNNCCLTAIKQKHSKWTKYLHCKSDGNYYQYKINRNKVISELRKAKYYHEKTLLQRLKWIAISSGPM